MDVKLGLAALGLGMFALSPLAQAQTSTPAPGSTQTIPEKDPSSSTKLKNERTPTSLQNGRSDSLSTKLNKSGGVIKPKGDVDPGMNAGAPVPHPNSTPVIPPSATGGQNAK